MTSKSKKKSHPPFYDDAPLKDPSSDRLGRAKLAGAIANAIVRMNSQNGFVLSLEGPWGSGKTTVINFIQHFLSTKPPAEKPLVVKFNPWWFTGSDDLLLRFLKEFRLALNAYDHLAC